eukprot:4179113-Amphidinium_carterae.1
MEHSQQGGMSSSVATQGRDLDEHVCPSVAHSNVIGPTICSAPQSLKLTQFPLDSLAKVESANYN